MNLLKYYIFKYQLYYIPNSSIIILALNRKALGLRSVAITRQCYVRGLLMVTHPRSDLDMVIASIYSVLPSVCFNILYCANYLS